MIYRDIHCSNFSDLNSVAFFAGMGGISKCYIKTCMVLISVILTRLPFFCTNGRHFKMLYQDMHCLNFSDLNPIAFFAGMGGISKCYTRTCMV